MAHAIQWLRSLFFNFQMYLMMLLIGVFFMPLSLIDRKYAYMACNLYCRWVVWTARWMIGLKSEVRGIVPMDEVIIASKHQSFFDIILIVSVVPKPKFIMKESLKRAPILGWYGKQLGCVPVNRGKRAEAIRHMLAAVSAGDAPRGQLIIYPQGTRVAPGVVKPYKVGSAALYEETGQECVPAATNVGVFWPRHSVLRKKGLAVVEFLPRVKAGIPAREFLPQIQATIEAASDKLLDEAGFERTND